MFACRWSLALAVVWCGCAVAHAAETSVAESPAVAAQAPAADAQHALAEPQIIQGRSGFFKRLPPRPMRTPTDRTAHIAALRAAYTRDSSNWPAPHVDAEVEHREIGLLPPLPKLDEDPIAKARVALGKRLYFEPHLSHNRQIACASCHDPELHWADGRSTSFGHQRKVLRRNAPTVMNTGFASSLFWDGRAGSLEEQAKMVLLNPDEMHSSAELVVERIGEIPGYQPLFEAAFPNEPVTIDTVTAAIAAYERTVVGGSSQFDAFLRGNLALSDEALVGLDLFRRDARCINCHNGPTFTDGKFHDMGLSYYGRKFEDLGRYQHTKDPADVGKFRTASLRNISHTGPYMHNGLFPNLRGVLNMYNAGMPTLTPKDEAQASDPLFPRNKSAQLKPLGLNRQDIEDLEAFLRTLQEPTRRVAPPEPLSSVTGVVPQR